MFVAVAHNCSKPTLMNGHYTGKTPVYTASCSIGYNLSGNATIVCTSDFKTTTQPSCIGKNLEINNCLRECVQIYIIYFTATLLQNLMNLLMCVKPFPVIVVLLLHFVIFKLGYRL